MGTVTPSLGARQPFWHGKVGSGAVVVGAVVLGAGLAGCGSSSPSTPATPAAPTSSVPTAPGTSAATTIKTASNPSLGTILVNSAGMTVYRFDADSATPPTSHCTGSCAAVWPPVMAGSASSVAQGFSQSELGTITRPDGSKQVTVGGWPVYTYTGDTAAGQANGEHLNLNGGVWWAITTGGARATPSPGAPSSSPGVKYKARTAHVASVAR